MSVEELLVSLVKGDSIPLNSLSEEAMEKFRSMQVKNKAVNVSGFAVATNKFLNTFSKFNNGRKNV